MIFSQPRLYFYTLTLIVVSVSLSAWGFDSTFDWNDEADDFLDAIVDDRALLLIDPETEDLLGSSKALVEKARSLKGPEYYEGGDKEAAKLKKEALEKILDYFEESEETIRVDLQSEDRPLNRVGPLELAGDQDCLILRVDSGTSEMEFGIREFPMGHEGDKGSVEIDISADGVTWVLLNLTEAPKLKTYFVLQFEREGKDPVRMPVVVKTPQHSRLKVSVLDDETGNPVPFMVSLIWGEDGNQRRPANAIDLEGRFESNGRPESLRRALIPGKFAGEYWCVPGPFDMTVPPGEWTLSIRRGLEYVPVTETFEIEPGGAATKSYTLRNWAKMDEKGWYSGDDHVHFRMTSDTDAEQVMTWTKAEGVRLSNILEMGDIAGTHFYQRGFGKDYRVEDDGYYLVPGQEGPRTHDELGHTIRLNTTSLVRFPETYFLYDRYYDEVHDQGGLSGFAHVNSGIFHITRSLTLSSVDGKNDFVEVFQFNNLGTQLFYEFLNLGFPMVLSAGSDVPWGGTIGEERVYVYLGDQPFNPDNWFEEFEKGRTFVTNGPMLEFEVDGALPGDTLSFSDPKTFKVKARAWGDADRFLPSRLDLIHQGETIASVTNTDDNLSSLELDYDLEESNGCWLAIRAIGSDGSTAHTTPVYLVREGMRFWKHDQALSLLEKRFQDLNDIEGLVEEATNRIEAGENILDTERWEDKALNSQAMKDSGPELLEEVNAAREFYTGLRELYEKEKGLR